MECITDPWGGNQQYPVINGQWGSEVSCKLQEIIFPSFLSQRHFPMLVAAVSDADEVEKSMGM